MIILTKQQILFMHAELIKEYGGIDGIRDHAILDSALAAPFQEFNGQDLFPSVQHKAARLGYGLIKNHAMMDGNKRIGTHAMLVFLAINGIELKYTQKELYTIILNVASDQSSLDELLSWILEHQI